MSISHPARAAAPLRQYGLVAVLLVVVAAVTFQYAHKTHHAQRSAFLRWRPQVLRLADEDIYARYAYPNPPIMALLLTPLALLPPWAGALGWLYLKLGLAALALHWTFRLVETPARPFPTWAKGLTVLLSLRAILGDLSHGNVNLLIVFLVVAALYALSRGRDVTAGLWLALAIACKVTPALFVFYLVWKRASRALLGCAAGLVLFLVVLPACFLGVEKNNQRLLSWYHTMVEPFVVRGEVTPEHENQSLPGLVFRLTTDSPSFSTFIDDRYTPLEYDNLVSLDPLWARLLVKGCMALFAGVVVWTCRTPAARRGGWRPAAEYGLIALGMLLFSERTWKHHCVTLLLPFAVLCYYGAACHPSRPLRWYLVGTLAAATLLMAATSTGPAGWWTELGKRSEVYGAYVWAYVLLAAALVVLLRRGEPAPSTDPG
jgi:hypothetical protein